MAKRFEVTYTYCVDASMTVEAETKEEAEEKVQAIWKSGDGSNERLKDFADFEVLSIKVSPYAPKKFIKY